MKTSVRRMGAEPTGLKRTVTVGGGGGLLVGLLDVLDVWRAGERDGEGGSKQPVTSWLADRGRCQGTSTLTKRCPACSKYPQ